MVLKTRNKFFEDSHENRGQKNGGKKLVKKFYNHNNVESKKMDFKKHAEIFFRCTRMSQEKKLVLKKRVKIFLKILTNNGSKKNVGEKTRDFF